MSDSEPVRSTSVRPLARLLSLKAPVWAISADGRLAYVSGSCAAWLQVDAESLLGRGGAIPVSASASLTTSPNPLDDLARSLLPPAGFSALGPAMRQVYPRSLQCEIPPRQCLFVPLPSEDGLGALAIADQVLPQDPTAWRDYHQLLDTLHRQLAMAPRRSMSAVALGTSVWAQRLVRQIDIASSSTMHITLSGPQGSGYESLARVIHATYVARSSERIQVPGDGSQVNAPFISVDGSLMDAELFDAATGSLVAHLLEHESSVAAIFIRDLDQMPTDAQARLELIVSNYPQRCRIIATTQLTSIELAPQLLSSLAARIGDMEIYIAPLKERLDDIPLMSAAMLQRRRAMGETRAEQISRDTLDRLVLYPWPGNFEELDAAIRNAAKQCRGETLHIDHLPLAIRTYGAVQATAEPVAKVAKVVPMDQALAAAERENILLALELNQGNRAAAARSLDISRPRLLRRMQTLQINWPHGSSGP